MGHCDKCNVDFSDEEADQHKHEDAAATEGGDASAESTEAPAAEGEKKEGE